MKIRVSSALLPTVLALSATWLVEEGLAFSRSVLLVKARGACSMSPDVQLAAGKRRHLVASRRNRETHCPKSQLTRRRLASDENDDDDDDEDDEEYEEQSGPLKDGVDSVSWLPSVIGAKGDKMPITSAKEVSLFLNAREAVGFSVFYALVMVLSPIETHIPVLFVSIPIRARKFFLSFLSVALFTLPTRNTS